MRSHKRPQDGFTLIETVIAMLVMSIAVVAIVGALSAMIGFTSEHRGHAVIETGARSFAQAVEAQAQSQAKLAVALPSTGTSLVVRHTSLLPPGDPSQLFVRVDREIMQVTKRVGDTLTVVRGIGDTTGGHVVDADVVPFTRCPGTGLMTPDSSLYPATTGLTYTVSKVEYWRQAGSSGSFITDTTDLTGCGKDFKTKCGTDILPECATGLLRVTLAIKSSDTAAVGYDPRFKGVDTTTVVLVRRGGS